MPDAEAEAKMRGVCDAILRADYVAATADLTPEALTQAMGLAAGVSAVPALPESYVVEDAGIAGAEQRFHVVFKAGEQKLGATVGWRRVEGAWKIGSIALDV